MDNKFKTQRLNLGINYLSIVLILAVFYIIKNTEISKIYLLAEIVPLSLAVWSFIQVFGNTGFWKLTHSFKRELDERELQLLYKATSLSYGFFIIVTLIIIYAYALVQKDPIDVVLAAALLYFAHTLPAAIIACRDKLV
jgi:hypothetical protein